MWKSFIKSKSNKFNLLYIKPYILFKMPYMTYMEVVLDCWNGLISLCDQSSCVSGAIWIVLFYYSHALDEL